MNAITANLTISFSGKREHPQLGHLKQALTDLFQALDSSLHGTHIQLLCGCADGADQIAAVVALDASLTNSSNYWAASGVFAFNQNDYKKTITNTALYDDIYGKLHQKLHLDGVFLADETGKAMRVRAHRQQGQMLGRYGDVLLAASVRSGPVKGGGTLENVVSALRSGKPVIFYDLEDLRFYLYHHVDELLIGDESYDERFAVTIPQIASWIKTYCDLDARPFEPLPDPDHKTFFGARKFVWDAFEKVVYKSPKKWEGQKSPVPKKFKETYDQIEAVRKEISEKANRYQIHYRGSYMLNYVLAATAILFAVAAMLYYIYALKYLPGVYWPLIALGICKIGLMFAIIRNTHEANHSGYNKVAIQYRYLSERLKFNRFSVIGGIQSPVPPTIGRHDERHLRNNSAEMHYQFLLSSLKRKVMDPIELSGQDIRNYAGYIADNWHEEQIAYHERMSRRHEQIYTRIEKLSLRLSQAVLGIVTLEVMLKLADSFDIEAIHPWSVQLGPPLLGLAAFLPAIVIILITINFQLEGRKLARRHLDQMSAIKALKHIFFKPQNKNTDCIFALLMSDLDNMEQLMIDEVADWTIFYENKVHEP